MPDPTSCSPGLGRLLPFLVAAVIAGCGGGSDSPPAAVTAPTGIAYGVNPATYTLGVAITPNFPSTQGGAVTAYSVSPALPAGLRLDASTGVVSGTPTALSPQATYTVTGSNAGGQASVALVVSVIQDVAPPAGLAYAVNPATYTVDTAIAPNFPRSSGGAITSYSVSPALPAGLTLDTITGVVSGTPRSAASRAAYRIVGSSVAGSTSVDLSIAVDPAQTPGLPVPVVLTVRLAASQVERGAMTSATATLVDGAGAPITGRSYYWSSSAPTVATVDASGRIEAVSVGTTTISAQRDGLTGTAILEVRPATVGTVLVVPSTQALRAGQTRMLQAVVWSSTNAPLTGPEYVVTWSSSSPSVVAIDPPYLLALSPGTSTITATCNGVAGTGTVTVSPPLYGIPDRLVAVTVERQTLTPGSSPWQAPAVQVLDVYGSPVEGVPVAFDAQAGSGSVASPSATTDADGVARSGTWTLGAGSTQSVVATSPALPGGSIAFSVVQRDPSAGYDVDLQFAGSFSEKALTAILRARERIMEIVVGDLPSQAVDTPACYTAGAYSGEVDDIRILVTLAPVAGINVAAQAGPCVLRANSHLPALGMVVVNSDMLTILEESGVLEAVMLHEMLHVVGFGTVWPYIPVLVGAGTGDPYFVGPGALQAFAQYNGGTTYPGNPVPVENTGGAGVRDGHWRETVLKDELMTEWISGPASPLSRTTAASLADLGYAVDLTRADAFDIRTASADPTADASPGGRLAIHLGADVIPLAPIAVDASGKAVTP